MNMKAGKNKDRSISRISATIGGLLQEEAMRPRQWHTLTGVCHCRGRIAVEDYFYRCNYRRILLRIMYFGWNYQGFVVQEDTSQTIEHFLFEALTKACLIESRDKANYHRCGRTDKGVSAFGQVISITVRSKLSADDSDISKELPYCKILNRLLPKDIRAVSWLGLPEDKIGYSARFDCKQRQYKYYFPKSSLNIGLMRQASKQLIGSHDFRNLCKMDVGNGVTEFTRTIIHADVCPVFDEDVDQPTSMFYLLIEGNAFLWHQIRCIMAILLLIGSGKETKDIITQLLDKDTNSRKPQYNMAIDVPLNLFKCSYDLEESNNWIYDIDELAKVIRELQGDWTMHNVKATMIKDCLKELEAKYMQMKETQDISEGSDKDSIIAYDECLTLGIKPKKYVPLLKRGTCSSLEEKIEHYKKRRKTEQNTELQHDVE